MTGSRLAGRRATAWLIRLGLLGAVALLVLAATIAVGTPSRPAAAARSGYDWVTSWGASPQDPSPGTLGFKGFHDQTVRDIIVPSIGGNMIRLELTNAFGRSPATGRAGRPRRSRTSGPRSPRACRLCCWPTTGC